MAASQMPMRSSENEVAGAARGADVVVQAPGHAGGLQLGDGFIDRLGCDV